MSTAKKVLVDSFGRNHSYLRLSLTERCNLRCTYCMPEQGVPLTPRSHLLTADETIRLARLFVQAGIKKIRLTGGEPTLRPDLVDIVGGLNELRRLGLEKIGITTNGIAVTRRLQSLKDAGLDHINVSLDTLDPLKFELMTRRRGFDKVVECVDTAVKLGFESVKINTVVIKNLTDSDILGFVEFTRNRPVYVRFIEYMPFDGNKWNHDKFLPYRVMLDKIEQTYNAAAANTDNNNIHTTTNVIRMQDEANDTSKAYKVSGYAGKFGFITSMSSNFCGTCNRLRVTADGSMKVCLFGNAEVSLRDAMRNESMSDDDILKIVQGAVQRKKKQHAVQTTSNSLGNHNNRYTMYSSFASPSSSTSLFPSATSHLYNLAPTHVHRAYSTSTKQPSPTPSHQPQQLSHIDTSGKASMVNISNKIATTRTAIATAQITFSSTEAWRLVATNAMEKGDVLAVSRIAGIQAAKLTPQLVPLCHPIPLSHISLAFDMNGGAGGGEKGGDGVNDTSISNDATTTTTSSSSYCRTLIITATVETGLAQTGVEVEAMTAVSIAAVNVFDMCKAVDKRIVIGPIRLIEKRGGKSGHFVA